MFDTHLNGHHRVSYYAHGPEWAFAIRRGDFDALRDVIRVCSRVWNGAGALILPVAAEGALPRDWERLVQTRPLTQTWLHPSLTTSVQSSLKRRAGLRAVDWHEGVFSGEIHPARLLDPPTRPEDRAAMTVPTFDSVALRRIADVTWGVVEHQSEWTHLFDVGVGGGDLALTTLVGGQLGFNMVSPLRVSQVSMQVFGQWDGQPWPYLWVFERGTFDELVAFWNFRSGAAADNSLASVVGIPYQALSQPDRLEAIATWALASTRWRTPTVLVKAAARRLAAVEGALAAVGLERLSEGEKPTLRDARPDPDRPSWLPWPPVLNGPVVRGAHDGVDFSVNDGLALITLPQPRGYRYRGGADLVVESLPTPLPITTGAAQRMFAGAYAHPRGLGINMRTASPWSLAVRLPDRHVALEDWAADHGYGTTESRAGMDARALLERLGNLEYLDALVDETRLEVLVALAPLSRKQLVDRLAKTFAPSGDRERLAEELTEALREEGLLLELDGRTVQQLKSALPTHDRRAIVAALAPLVERGFIRRGRNVRCPRCRFAEFRALEELAEDVRCNGCGHEYALPVAAADGNEASLAYRLDSLMGRIMDQHVLPVVLALRALRDPERGSAPTHVWPGVLFERPNARPFDIDLLASSGATVFVAECKLDARGLRRPQLSTLLEFATEVGATPVVAALAGEFSPQVRRKVEDNGGLVLQRRELLTIGERPSYA